jgi:hypothetical protein
MICEGQTSLFLSGFCLNNARMCLHPLVGNAPVAQHSFYGSHCLPEIPWTV